MTEVRIEVDDVLGTATVCNDDESYTLHNIHRARQCAGNPCVIHNPSDHEYRDTELVWENGSFWWSVAPDHNGMVPDPDALAYRESLAGPKIKCLNCDDVIQSKSRHDFVTCKCGATSVDGGSDYTRTLGSQWGYFSHVESQDVQ